ncbi:MAG: tripartite tricarboxylate transporter TctB family protein [Pseudorhodobacter sp.]
MSKRGTNILLAFLLLAGVLLFYVESFNVRNFPGTRFGAEIWPRAILICMGVLALALLVASLRQTGEEAEKPGLGAIIGREGIALTVFASFLGFLLLVPRLGAYLSGAIFVFAVLTFLGPKTRRATVLHLAIAIGMTIVLWGIFSGLLNVIVPSGRWMSGFWQAVRS